MNRRELLTVKRIIEKIKYNELELSKSVGNNYIKNDVVYNSYGNFIRHLDERELELYDKIKIFKNALSFYLE